MTDKDIETEFRRAHKCLAPEGDALDSVMFDARNAKHMAKAVLYFIDENRRLREFIEERNTNTGGHHG